MAAITNNNTQPPPGNTQPLPWCFLEFLVFFFSILTLRFSTNPATSQILIVVPLGWKWVVSISWHSSNIGMMQYITNCFLFSIFSLQSCYILPPFPRVYGHVSQYFILFMLFTLPLIIFLMDSSMLKSFITKQVIFSLIWTSWLLIQNQDMVSISCLKHTRNWESEMMI